MDKIFIRKIKQSDNTSLAKIIRQAFHDFNVPTKGTVYEDPTTDEMFEWFDTEGAVCWVAELNNEIVGCCGIYPTSNLPEGCVELVKFYMLSEGRGKGIGKLLMEKSIASAKELGYRQVYIESLPEFDKAVNIYVAQGFRWLRHPLGNSGHTGCTVWMVKEL